ncbi:IS3 family transposase [Flavonifractor porci]|uniref:IS3 family transposase n=1 Tax=Flavonifractor porci TaxID=3133422 RepID=UPI003CCC845E
MCKFFGVSRSGYYAFVHRQGRPEKDAALSELIAQQRERSFRTYGYRRMWLWLKSQNIFRNPKTVLRSCSSTAARVLSTPHKHILS